MVCLNKEKPNILDNCSIWKTYYKTRKVLLQFTTAWIITNHDTRLLQFTVGTLLQITTTVITIYDRYYNSRQLLLQFTTGITIHDVITIHDSTALPLSCWETLGELGYLAS